MIPSGQRMIEDAEAALDKLRAVESMTIEELVSCLCVRPERISAALGYLLGAGQAVDMHDGERMVWCSAQEISDGEVDAMTRSFGDPTGGGR